MLLAIVATLVGEQILTWQWIIGGLLIGTVVGGFMARFVKMTAMPQMVGLFNGFGGLASGLVAAAEFLRYSMGVAGTAEVPVDASISIMLGTLIGAVTFSGSLVAFGKLQGIVTEKAVRYPAQQFLNAVLFLGILAVMAYLVVMTPEAIVASDTGTVNIIYYALWGGAMLLGCAARDPDRRSRHARRRVAAELLLRARGVGRRFRAQQQRPDHLRCAGWRLRTDPHPDHVQGHEPVAGQRHLRFVRPGPRAARSSSRARSARWPT